MISDNDEARERAYTWDLIRRETNDELYDIVCKGRRRWTVISNLNPFVNQALFPFFNNRNRQTKKSC